MDASLVGCGLKETNLDNESAGKKGREAGHKYISEKNKGNSAVTGLFGRGIMAKQR